MEGSVLANGIASDAPLDVDLLGETVEADQLALSDDDGSDVASNRPRSRRARARKTAQAHATAAPDSVGSGSGRRLSHPSTHRPKEPMDRTLIL